VIDAEQGADPVLHYRSNHQLGLFLETQGDLDGAMHSLTKATGASHGHSDLIRAHAASANDLGVVMSRLGRHEEALERLRQAFDLARRANLEDVAFACQRNQGLVHWADNDRSSALDLWDTVFDAARRVDDAVGNAQILNNVGVMRLLEKDREAAFQLFTRALLLAQRGGDLRNLAFIYNNIGVSYAGPPHGDHVAAVPFVEMALALLTSATDVLGRLYALNNCIIEHEQVQLGGHVEPDRKFRNLLAETLKSFTTPYPSRFADIEQVRTPNHPADDVTVDREWALSTYPVLLRSCSRCGVQE